MKINKIKYMLESMEEKSIPLSMSRIFHSSFNVENFSVLLRSKEEKLICSFIKCFLNLKKKITYKIGRIISLFLMDVF
jgi:hypothetical protein